MVGKAIKNRVAGRISAVLSLTVGLVGGICAGFGLLSLGGMLGVVGSALVLGLYAYFACDKDAWGSVALAVGIVDVLAVIGGALIGLLLGGLYLLGLTSIPWLLTILVILELVLVIALMCLAIALVISLSKTI